MAKQIRTPGKSARHYARILGEALDENLQADAEHIGASQKRIMNSKRGILDAEELVARSQRALKRSRGILTKNG